MGTSDGDGARNQALEGLDDAGKDPSPAPAGGGESGLPEPAERSAGTWRARFLARGPLKKDAHDRLALFCVRAVFFAVAAGLGLYGANVLGRITNRPDLNPLAGVAMALATAAVLIVLEMLFSRGPIRTISAVAVGLLIGFVLSLVFQPVVEFVARAVASPDVRLGQGFSALLSFLHVLTTAIFCYFGVTLLLQTKDDFKFIIPYVEFRKAVKGHTPLIFDTSSFVDGRIEAIIATALFDRRLVVPKFVLAELQTIADSADRSLRERGRRGMDILNRVDRAHHLEVVDRPRRPGEDVDRALISLATELEGKIVTTDYNLQKSARLQGVPVLNINDLATALKPEFVPGEAMTVRLLREGDEKGQAVGFLRDGTMVVVESARHRIGQEVQVEVTSSLQTSAGKMVFGKLRRQGKAGNEG
jgi:uncharacterized protein YacL